MKIFFRKVSLCTSLLLLCWGVAAAQKDAASHADQQTAQLLPNTESPAPAMEMTASGAAAQPVIANEIQDPATGIRWLFLRDAEHPGAPDRLVMEASSRASAEALSEKPVIHAGDSIVVEEHTQLVDASLSAIALTSAAKDKTLRARTTIGGRILVVRAVSAGSAEIVTEAAQ